MGNSRWTAADVHTALKRGSRTKYGSKKVQIDGIWFDSKHEGARYSQLKMMQESGLIEDLKCHPEFMIGIKGIWVCTVELDFQYWDKVRNITVYEDTKGYDTAESKLKRKLVEAEYGITVEVIR